MTESQYNYAVFDMSHEDIHFDSFFDRVNVGTRAPDGELEDLGSGDTVKMSSLWENGPALIEFGSFT